MQWCLSSGGNASAAAVEFSLYTVPAPIPHIASVHPHPLQPTPDTAAKQSQKNISAFTPKGSPFGVKSKDYESKSKDYGPKSKDYGPKSKDYESKSKDYGPKSKTYRPKSKDYGPKSKDYGSKSKDYESKSKDYGPKSKTYRPKGSPFGLPPLQASQHVIFTRLSCPEFRIPLTNSAVWHIM